VQIIEIIHVWTRLAEEKFGVNSSRFVVESDKLNSCLNQQPVQRIYKQCNTHNDLKPTTTKIQDSSDSIIAADGFLLLTESFLLLTESFLLEERFAMSDSASSVNLRAMAGTR
jgi:hypothetical protein